MKREPHPLVYLAAIAAASSLCAQTTVKSGVYSDPAIWDTGLVPTATADVVIAAGHHVGMGPTGMYAPTLMADSLVVDGTLTPNYPVDADGSSLRILALDVVVNGTVLGEDDATGSGGSVSIAAPWGLLGVFPPAVGPLPGTFLNTGIVRGGDAVGFAGSVTIDYTNGVATNDGLLEGGDGDSGGDVMLIGEVATNTGGMTGGAAVDGFGGDADLLAYTFPLSGASVATNDGVVEGGPSGEGRGGDATVSAFSWPPFGTADVVNDGDILGGPGCTAGGAFLLGATSVTNRGTLRAGAETPGTCAPAQSSVRVDPPDAILEGDARFYADRVELLGGSSLTIRNLSPTSIIDANEELVITLAPGGVLDLSQLAPGMISAPQTIVRADSILLPPGVSLTDLIGSSTLTLGPGAIDVAADVMAGGDATGQIGDTANLHFAVANAGNGTDLFTIDLAGPADFSQESHAVTLAPGEIWRTDVAYVPSVPGQVSFELSATPSSAPSNARTLSFPYDAYDRLCAVDTFGEPGGLTMHVEPGAAITAPFLSVQGGAPFQPAIVAFSMTPIASPGLEVLGMSLYLFPDGLFHSTLTTLVFGPTGTALMPFSMQHPLTPTIHAQAVQLNLFEPGSLPFSNALSLTFCP